MNQEELNIICGDRLRKCIKKKNMTQKDVAAAAHFTEQHISNIKRGVCKLTTDTARALSDVLGVRMEYLLCEDDYETKLDYYLSSIKSMEETANCLCKILDCKGYSLHHDKYTESSEPFKTITLNTNEVDSISDGALNKLIAEKMESATEQTTIALKHPDGRIIRISSKHFHDLLTDIENYIDYKMHMEYEDIRNYMLNDDMIDNNGNNIADKFRKECD